MDVSSGTNEGLVSGDTHNVTFSASGKVAGKYPGTITEKENVKIESGETDVTANYDITVVNGALTITQSSKALVVTSSTESWTYDGQTHTDEVYSVTYDGSPV